MSSVPGTVLNELFASQLDSPDGKAKLAQVGATFIRDRLREESFARKIVPPQGVTRAECQRSVNHDTLVKVVDIEPKSKAMSLSFRAQPKARYITGPRYEIPFWTISSEKFEKTEQELLAYEMPITKIIEQNAVKDVQELEDRQFLLYCEACVQALQDEGNIRDYTARQPLSNATVGIAVPTCGEYGIVKGYHGRDSTEPTDFAAWPVQKEDFSRLFKLFVGREGTRLRVDRFLITDYDFEDMMQWTVEDVGSQIKSEVVVDGYRYTQVLGRKFVRTLKTDILRPGNIYAFTTPDFFGRFYILNQIKFYIDKVANRITWQCWEDIGMGFGNIAAVRKLELYTGSATPGLVTGAVTPSVDIVIPKPEEELGAENNRAADGIWYPKVFHTY